MTVENDFLPFAPAPGANVLTQAQYAALTALPTGFSAGTASSAGANKVWRQSSLIASVIAQFIVANSGQPAIDDGTTATLLANFGLALQAFGAASGYTPIIGDARNAQMSVTAASATATFTADELIVGSALGGPSHKIGSFNQTVNLAANGANGMDTGAAPASGYVALYAIYNPSTGATALLATNASASIAPSVYGGGHMPAGYTMSALVSVWPTGGSGQFMPGFQAGRAVSIGFNQVLSTSAPQASATALSIAGAAPPNAKMVSGSAFADSTLPSTTVINLYASTSQLGAQTVGLSASGGGAQGAQAMFSRLPIITQQTIYYTASNTAGTPTFFVTVNGYEF